MKTGKIHKTWLNKLEDNFIVFQRQTQGDEEIQQFKHTDSLCSQGELYMSQRAVADDLE